MDNSIAAILEMDKKARAVSDEAAAKAEKMMADAQARKDRLKAENSEKIAAGIEKKMTALKEASDKEIAAAENAAAEKCRMLDEKMAAGREAWKKEVLDNILRIE